MKRIYNFSAGPATLNPEVLERSSAGLLEFNDSGMGIAEISHRSKDFIAVMDGARNSVRKMLQVPKEFDILLLQGGATLQFSMLAFNFLRRRGDYVITGAWSQKAVSEAAGLGKICEVASSIDKNFSYIPKGYRQDPGADYLHITSNNTIFGTQFQTLPTPLGCPLIVDASSDIMSRPIDFTNIGLLYAGAQKNIGPSGVVLVIVRRDLAQAAREDIPGWLRYQTHIEGESMSNTPPTFAVYMLKCVMDWMEANGGVSAMEKKSLQKSKLLYDQIDAGDFYTGNAAPEDRSRMNVTFTLPSEALSKSFLEEVGKQGMDGLKGHRSVGGIRASIYNAMPLEGVKALAGFMADFAKRHG